MGNYLDSGFNEKLMRTSFGDLPQNQAVDVVNAGEVIATGAIPISAVTDALTSANIINSDNLIITDVINENLDTQAKEILGEFIFVATGALAMATDSDNGLWISPTGILGKKAGVNTFAVDTSGNATFAGSLVAATGTLGTLTIATGGNIKKGKTAYSDDTNAGFWLGDDSGTTKMNFGASATKYLHYDGSNLTIAGGTITGGIVQTSASSYRIKLDGATNQLQFLLDDTVKAYIATASGEDLALYADDDIYFAPANTKKCHFGSNGLFPESNDSYDLGESGKEFGEIHGDQFYSNGNSGNTVDRVLITDSYSYWTGSWTDIKKKYRTFEFTGGILTGESSETTATVLAHVWNG